MRAQGFLLSVLLAAGCGRLQYELAIDASIAPDASIDAALDAGPPDASIDAALDGGDGRPLDAAAALRARPLAPWSTSQASSLRPTFRFELDPGADSGRVELCRDPACVTVVATFEGPGVAQPATEIPHLGPSAFFWRVTPLRAGESAGPPSAMWTFTGRYAASATVADASFGSRLDLDADGFAEVAIGAPAAGEVRIHAGSSAGPSGTRTWTLRGTTGLGSSLASAGDVDGDGRAELLVGSPDAASFTLAWLERDDTLASAPFAGAAGSRLGATVTGIGDANGDGYSDVAVGAPGEARVYVHYGSATGLGTSRPIAGSGDFGAAVTGGDFDGDGFGDLAVAEPSADRVHVFFGSGSGLAGSARVVLTGTAGTRFGESIAGHGDGTADGRCDLVVGIPGDGVAQVYAGEPAGLSTSVTFSLDETTAGFGRVVAFIPVTDLKGYDDVLVAGDPGNALTIYFSQSRGTGAVPGWVANLDPEVGATDYGFAIAGLHDVDGDRYTEVAVGAPASATAYVYSGSAGGLGRVTALTGAAGSRVGAAIDHP